MFDELAERSLLSSLAGTKHTYVRLAIIIHCQILAFFMTHLAKINLYLHCQFWRIYNTSFTKVSTWNRFLEYRIPRRLHYHAIKKFRRSSVLVSLFLTLWPDLSVYKNSYSVHFLPIQHAGAHDGAQIGIGGGGGGGGSIIGGGGAVQHCCGQILIQ